MEHKNIIRCRGIIVDGDKMLAVENDKNDFLCLPGGKLEFGENPKQALEREILEELGFKPEIGRLLYINTFIDKDDHATEFLYEILNVLDYKDIDKLKGTHSFELSKIVWMDKESKEKFLPSSIWQDFKEGNIPKDKERYING